MAGINMASIMAKVRAFAKSDRGKSRINNVIYQYRQDGVGKTDGGDMIVTMEDMHHAAREMIRILKETASSHHLPQSVLDHFDSLYYTDITNDGDKSGVYVANISFADSLGRMSLLIVSGKRKGRRTGDGIENIISLFDTGTKDTGKQVRGLWDGHEELGAVLGVMHRDGENFMKEAVDTFNRIYGQTYSVYAYISADPEYYTR